MRKVVDSRPARVDANGVTDQGLKLADFSLVSIKELKFHYRLLPGVAGIIMDCVMISSGGGLLRGTFRKPLREPFLHDSLDCLNDDLRLGLNFYIDEVS